MSQEKTTTLVSDIANLLSSWQAYLVGLEYERWYLNIVTRMRTLVEMKTSG